jgi:hypothetical protein
MSLDQALQQLRHARVEPPTFREIEQRRRWKAERALPQKRLWIALVATLVAIVGYLVLTIRPLTETAFLQGGSLEEWWRVSLATLVPAALLGWAFACTRRQGVGPQMLARAICWSNLLVGMLIAGNFMVRFDQFVGAAIAVACAVSLLSLGSRGLDAAPGDPFQPVRFRGQLLLALVMAFADAQTLLFSAALQLRVGMLGWTLGGTIVYAGPAALAALVMGLAVWGLYRLRTWALLLNLVANFAIAYLALDGVLNLAPPVALALFATAACQALLPVPILAIALGDRRAGKPWLQGHATRLLPVSVVAIAGAAVVSALLVTDPEGWLTGPGRAFGRGMHVTQTRGRFRHAPMQEADLSGWTESGDFELADLSQANLRHSDMRGSSFMRATLHAADLSGGDFSGVSFVRADLTRAQLRGARLRNADLVLARLARADLEGADLLGAKIEAMTPDLAATIRWIGATCPDGTSADRQRGCIGREGHVPPAERAEYEGTFRLQSGIEGCTGWGTSTRRAIVADTHLYFADAFHVRRAADVFATATSTLRYDRSDGDVRIVVEDDECGRRVFVRVD